MPQPREKKHGHDMRVFVSTARTAERNIDILGEPLHERAVPAMPQLDCIAREKGIEKVVHQAYAEQFRRAFRYVAVSREITVNLQGKSHGPDHTPEAVVQPDVSGMAVICNIDPERHPVGNDTFLEQSPQNQPRPLDRSGIIPAARGQELGQQLGGALDGAGHKLWEERNEHAEGHDVACRGYATLVDVHRIADCLEGIERYSHRQQNLDGEPVELITEHGKKPAQVVAEKVEIFKSAQYQEIHHHTQRCPRLPVGLRQRAAERQQGRKGDEAEKAPVPPTVKHIARGKQEHVLRLETAAQREPVDEKHHRQE